MNISLELRPEVEAELARQASATGLALEAHATALLEEAARLPPRTVRPAQTGTSGKRLVDAFAQARAILDGVELDLARDPSPGRPTHLS